MLGVFFFAIISTAPAREIAQGEAKGFSEEALPMASLDGRSLFRAHCATCHGKDAKGNGPMISALKKMPPDLTRISEMNGGRFPFGRVEKAISGDEPGTVAHGSREMPVWGPFFAQNSWDHDIGKVRIRELTKYIGSLQVK
jgi:mono/diheme cytochrome c family protein